MSHIYTEVFNCGLALIRLYMHIYMYIGRIYFRVALIRKYIYGYIYMEVFSLQLGAQIFISAYILVGLG